MLVYVLSQERGDDPDTLEVQSVTADRTLFMIPADDTSLWDFIDGEINLWTYQIGAAPDKTDISDMGYYTSAVPDIPGLENIWPNDRNYRHWFPLYVCHGLWFEKTMKWR